jgi:glycosyltransferase involved in cell wall biosynthesis
MASGRVRPQAVGAPTEIIFYGFVAQAKGLELLIEAAHELQKQGIAVRLHVVGGSLDQGYERSLVELASRLSLERAIVWHGFVDEGQLDRILASGGVVVMPYRETKSLGGSAAVVRAMEHGLPVILSGIRRFTGEYDDGVDALMFPEGDVQKLVANLRAVITDAELRNRLADGSRRRIQHVHDPKIVAGAFRALYDEIS